MRPAVVLGSLLVLAFALPGCLNEESTRSPLASVDTESFSERVEVAKDDEGDARVYGLEAARAVFVGKCGAAPQAARSVCRSGTDALSQGYQPPPGTGIPEPALDILSASLVETQDSLVVEISIAALERSLAGVVADNGEITGGWGLCWTPRGDPSAADGGADECVHLYAEMYDGTLVLEPTFERSTYACNDWGWCVWLVPYQIEYGAPATLRLTVPRAIMGGADAGDVLEVYSGFSWREHRPAVGHASGMSLEADVNGLSDELDLENEHSYRTDESSEHAAFAFETDRLEVAGFQTGNGVANDAGDAGRADIDALSVEFVEDPDSLTVAIRVAEVNAVALDHSLWMGFGMPSGRFHMAGYSIKDGSMQQYSGHWNDSSLAQWIEYPAEFLFAAGAPGWINITIARSDLQSPPAGGLVNLMDVVLSYATIDQASPQVGSPALARAYVAGLNDGMLSPPFWFQMDTA